MSITYLNYSIFIFKLHFDINFMQCRDTFFGFHDRLWQIILFDKENMKFWTGALSNPDIIFCRFSKLGQNRENSYFFKPPYQRHYLLYMNEVASIIYRNYSIFTFQTSFWYSLHANYIIMENQKKMLNIVLNCISRAEIWH